MNITEARAARAAVIARRTELVIIAQATAKGREAWRMVEEADWAVDFAQHQVEDACRAAMPDARFCDVMAEALR